MINTSSRARLRTGRIAKLPLPRPLGFAISSAQPCACWLGFTWELRAVGRPCPHSHPEDLQVDRFYSLSLCVCVFGWGGGGGAKVNKELRAPPSAGWATARGNDILSIALGTPRWEPHPVQPKRWVAATLGPHTLTSGGLVGTAGRTPPLRGSGRAAAAAAAAATKPAGSPSPPSQSAAALPPTEPRDQPDPQRSRFPLPELPGKFPVFKGAILE